VSGTWGWPLNSIQSRGLLLWSQLCDSARNVSEVQSPHISSTFPQLPRSQSWAPHSRTCPAHLVCCLYAFMVVAYSQGQLYLNVYLPKEILATGSMYCVCRHSSVACEYTHGEFLCWQILNRRSLFYMLPCLMTPLRLLITVLLSANAESLQVEAESWIYYTQTRFLRELLTVAFLQNNYITVILYYKMTLKFPKKPKFPEWSGQGMCSEWMTKSPQRNWC
jgi:hypothetical protein